MIDRKRRPAKSVIVEDEFYPDEPRRLDVIVEDAQQNTGLLDQYGVPIYRVRQPIGFGR